MKNDWHSSDIHLCFIRTSMNMRSLEVIESIDTKFYLFYGDNRSQEHSMNGFWGYKCFNNFQWFIFIEMYICTINEYNSFSIIFHIDWSTYNQILCILWTSTIQYFHISKYKETLSQMTSFLWRIYTEKHTRECVVEWTNHFSGAPFLPLCVGSLERNLLVTPMRNQESKTFMSETYTQLNMMATSCLTWFCCQIWV